jgi:hypothetical protein
MFVIFIGDFDRFFGGVLFGAFTKTWSFLIVRIWKMAFAKLIFSRQNFFLLRKISLFQNTKKKVLAGKN